MRSKYSPTCFFCCIYFAHFIAHRSQFSQYSELDVLAVDLCPAVDAVLQCDFLDVDVGDATIFDEVAHRSKSLKKSSDYVVCCYKPDEMFQSSMDDISST